MGALTRLARPLAAILLASCAASTTAQTGNSIRVESVKTGLDTPWTIRFSPADDRLWFTTRNTGTLSALDLKTGNVQSLKGPEIRDEGEGGMLGFDWDPNYNDTKRVFICYSYWGSDQTRLNRVSSFRIENNRLSSEKPLIDAMPGWSNHNGCRVTVGPDKFLYVSMGDAANTANSQDLKSKAGKIHRVGLDGSIPNDNPFPNSTVWSYGHRNPQGLAFQPGTNRLWSTEHGPNTDDELNIIVKGKNYGWPDCKGTERCSNLKDYQAAVASYNPGETIAISDLVFYTGNAFPDWKNDILFVSLKTGRLYHLNINDDKIASQNILIDNQYGRLRDLVVGPDGFLYISTDGGGDSRILRVRPR